MDSVAPILSFRRAEVRRSESRRRRWVAEFFPRPAAQEQTYRASALSPWRPSYLGRHIGANGAELDLSRVGRSDNLKGLTAAIIQSPDHPITQFRRSITQPRRLLALAAVLACGAGCGSVPSQP